MENTKSSHFHFALSLLEETHDDHDDDEALIIPLQKHVLLRRVRDPRKTTFYLSRPLGSNVGSFLEAG